MSEKIWVQNTEHGLATWGYGTPSFLVRDRKTGLGYARAKIGGIYWCSRSLAATIHLDESARMLDELMISAPNTRAMQHNLLEELHFDEIGSKLNDDFERRQSNGLSRSTFPRHGDLPNQTVILVNRTRLPELKLPTFTGDYTNYSEFITIFESVVDKDLRSCLSGLALDSVRSLEFSGANYRVALDILNRRFSNERLVLQAHINEILRLKMVYSESVSKLREFLDKVDSHMRVITQPARQFLLQS
ncbi:uncharacterized protein [Drosophila virilis]|uniref:uncharacterized protein n=1 Tax=Drosophila virilis TaxID=7244 RepID=UPI00017D6177